MPHKVLIVDDEVDALRIIELKEKYGDDVVIVTPQQAKEQGLTMTDFANTPTMKLINPYVPTIHEIYKSGKELRRERRAAERKNKKR